MNAVGLITEFNPFHNGHQYILEEAKKRSSADCVICVMSGHFVQRGEGSIYNKWERAENALSHGADLVVELPVTHVLQSAEGFALGGLHLLKSLLVDFVSFGTETEDFDSLFKFADLLCHPTPQYLDALHCAMDRGLGYAAAQAEAIDDIPLTPNNILALSYLKAGNQLGFSPTWIPVKRIGVSHDGVGDGSYTSASHIRNLLKEGGDTSSFLPYQAKCPELNPSLLEVTALSALRKMSPDELRDISGVSEGLENRIHNASMEKDFDTFITACVTKRYTASRIRRIAYCALLGITKSLAKKAPSYLRILGMNEGGQQYLKEKKDSFSLPIIVKTADATLDSMLEKDILATNLWSLATDNPQGMNDYYKSPIIIKKGENR